MIEAGMDRGSPTDILAGYRKLTEVQQQFPQDSEMYNSFGSALMAGHQYSEAVKAFELAARLDPTSSKRETSLGQAYLLLGERDDGEHHLERALELDPLNLTAADLLIRSYDQSGKPERSEELSKRLARLVGSTDYAK
jgi:Flp pilus assembly protein TadD